MANVTTELKVVVRSVGKGEIDKLSDALVKLGKKAVEPVNDDLKKSVQDLKRLSSQSTQTKNRCGTDCWRHCCWWCVWWP